MGPDTNRIIIGQCMPPNTFFVLGANLVFPYLLQVVYILDKLQLVGPQKKRPVGFNYLMSRFLNLYINEKPLELVIFFNFLSRCFSPMFDIKNQTFF